MGEAKQRGTYEQRVIQSKQRQEVDQEKQTTSPLIKKPVTDKMVLLSAIQALTASDNNPINIT